MRNGLLPMLKRNIAIKTAPQRWQENADDGPFDVVFTFEERVFDVVLEGTFPVEAALWKTEMILLVVHAILKDGASVS
jgi:RNA polymerase II subunit A C-terminal domain phosphatase SSU72